MPDNSGRFKGISVPRMWPTKAEKDGKVTDLISDPNADLNREMVEWKEFDHFPDGPDVILAPKGKHDKR
jgi:hypothetical protein